jgi:23S rRNA pseudouridine2605 synthase
MTNTDSSADSLRLNKYIASALAIGRRQVDVLIEKGRVLVNGESPALGARVKPGDIITVDGKPVKPLETTFMYLALNKPVGYVCSRRQQGDTPTIYALLPEKYHHLKPVGRLDKDSSGLLLLTNDGDFAHRMTHPSFVKVKRYEVTLDHALEPLHHQMINDHGINLPDGVSKLQLERINDGDNTHWFVTMHEGRNRQIRRTFEALGYHVVELHRFVFGPYNLDNLKPGQFNEIIVS